MKKDSFPRWVWAGLAAVIGFQAYFVRELLAAIIIFSVLFAVVAGIALVIYLIQKGGASLVVSAERAARRAIHAGRQPARVQ